MSRQVLCFLFALMLLPVTNVLADIGVFENAADVHPVQGTGSTEYMGYVNDDGRLVEQYLVTGHGDDIWNNQDAFHYAYRTMSGDWRVSAEVEWVGNPADAWAKQGVMIRDSLDRASVHYSTFVPNYNQGLIRTDKGFRETYGGGSGNEYVDGVAGRVGIQRVLIGGEIPAIESIADFGNGWERIGNLTILPAIHDEALFGVAVTSHTWTSTATSKVTDVVYERAQMVGAAPMIAEVPAVSMKADPGKENGFVIRTVKAMFTDGWGRAEMDKLLDFGCTGPLCLGADMPVPGVEEGVRISQFVNLHDTAGRGNFANDESFPGIDPFESPTADPAAGDDDDNFATEVLAIIQLKAGMHMIGVNDDDGTIVEIGGIEIGRSGEWKGTSDTNFIFSVVQDGFYTLRARHLEGGGGAALEMYEFVKGADGLWKKILLGDVANGGSAVFVPEPATLALLGLGALVLLRRRK